jgi:hypothetical protein
MKHAWISCTVLGLAAVTCGCMAGGDDSGGSSSNSAGDVYSNSYGSNLNRGVIQVVDQTWHCNGPVNDVQVE